MRLIFAALALLAALTVPLTAAAHARKAVPSDPALHEQYQAGLAAYLNRDYAAALKAWRPLAEQKTESSAAQIFLGFMHAKGLGVEPDPLAAVAWYRRAADQDDMLAQLRLGLLYRGGEGAAPDSVQAFLWITLAARQESHVQKVAQALQEAVAAELTPAQLTEAKHLVDAWIETHRKGE
jgi:TPR repeat protein